MHTRQFKAPTLDGLNLAVTATGDKPSLLLIPGLGASRRVYDPLVEQLAPNLQLAVFDPRGIGESDPTTGPFTMRQLAGDVVAVIDALGKEQIAVFGASMGGMVAQHVALDYPQRVSRLILGATNPGGRKAIKSSPEARDALLGKGAKTPAEAYAKACEVLYSQPFRKQHPEFIEEQIQQRSRFPVRPGVFQAQYEATKHHDTFYRLVQIAMPTLVMHGTLDLISPLRNGYLLADHIPNADRCWLSDLGHLFFHEEPEFVAEVLREFLAPNLKNTA